MLLATAIPASAATLEQLTPYLSGQYYTWDEHSGGRRLLKEEGALVAGGVTTAVLTDFSLAIKGRGELFGGDIGYRGETQAPDPVPAATDVIYFGAKGECDAGYRASSGPFAIEPFAGLGYRWWLRDLQDTRSASGRPISGYTEYWQTGYARLGARGSYRSGNGVSAFFEGGAKYPFYVGNTVDFEGFGNTTFRPRGKWSAFAETGVQYDHLKIALSYEGYRFSQSPLKLVGTRLFFQPDSSSDIFGLSVGWAFR